MATDDRDRYATCINHVPLVTGSTYALALLTFLEYPAVESPNPVPRTSRWSCDSRVSPPPSGHGSYFQGRQLLFIPMEALPTTEAHAAHLQAALAGFLGLPTPQPRHARLCLQKRLVTRDFLRSENATTRELKARFVASRTGRELSRFFLAQHALLPDLIAREGVQVYERTS